VPTLRDEDVRRFYVTVNNPFAVRGIERVRNLDAQRQHCFSFQRPPCNSILQSHAIQKLHHDERLISVLADLVNCADIGMIQGRGSSCLASKAFERLRVSS